MRKSSTYRFDPELHRERLVPMIEALRALEPFDSKEYQKLLRRFPKLGGGAYSKSEIIKAFRQFAPSQGWPDEAHFVSRLRMKPVRTLSGVAPVTVLTKPYPCPGRCIFCPSDVRMPKSYITREPGAQRAAQHRFDPYGQTLGRLLTYHHNGHRVDKVELIILGGTWSSYPEAYQIWFVLRCFDAMNDFQAAVADRLPSDLRGETDFTAVGEAIDGAALGESQPTYNEVVSQFLRRELDGRLLDRGETATWEELEAAHRRNEDAEARCVGLVAETRPDHLSEAETYRLRRLGCTKIQIGIQSLDDRVLELNRRGHDVEATRRALGLLRGAGFKLHVHWMPNLYGSNPAADAVDFRRLFEDPAIRPDELKIYPCSLIETAELMAYYESGAWRPYGQGELADLLEACLLEVPEYCRVTRVIRDIPGDEIVDGNRTTNFRQVVEERLQAKGLASRDIRAREIRRGRLEGELRLGSLEYETAVGCEVFLQILTTEDRLAGFCRLSLPASEHGLPELRGAAIIREVHVYGGVVGFDGDGAAHGHSQHRGLGRRLVEAAAALATERGFATLAVISAVGTRGYYRRLGFEDGALYQHRPLQIDGNST